MGPSRKPINTLRRIERLRGVSGDSKKIFSIDNFGRSKIQVVTESNDIRPMGWNKYVTIKTSSIAEDSLHPSWQHGRRESIPLPRSGQRRSRLCTCCRKLMKEEKITIYVMDQVLVNLNECVVNLAESTIIDALRKCKFDVSNSFTHYAILIVLYNLV